MCYRTRLNSKIAKIERTFDAAFLDPEKYHPQSEINAFDFLATPVIADFSQTEILFYNWGLIPFWAKNEAIKKSTLNAKIETLKEKPAFRDAVSKRCLIIADGYYEWQWQDTKGKQKQKYLITSAEEEVFALAGLYSTWKEPHSGRVFETYTIITTEANQVMSEIHNNKKRMPVMLRKSDHAGWLQGKNIEEFAFPYEAPLEAKQV